MSRSLLLAVLAAALAASGCTPSARENAAAMDSSAAGSPAPGSPAAGAPAPTGDTLVVLERYHTLGPRAAYVVRIETGGVVHYDGRASAGGRALLGPRRVETDTLDAGALRRLVGQFQAAGFDAMPDSLLGGAPPCGPTPTDGGLARTALTMSDRTHQVVHELKCPAPQSAALAALEDTIDRTAGTGRWTGESR